MDSFTKSHQHLKRHSIKPSVQRTAIMEYLLNNRIHPCIEDIYNSLHPMMPTLSKTTVYNTMNLFIENNAVRVLFLDGKNARYDIGMEEHAHFVCKLCGGVHDVFGLKKNIFKIPKLDEFDIHSGEIVYAGICNCCREKSKSN